MAMHLISTDREGSYKKCCKSSAVDGNEQAGDVRSERKM